MKVPGNFHVSSHHFGSILALILGGKHQTLDLSHTIKHLSFGNDEEYYYVKRYNKLYINYTKYLKSFQQQRKFKSIRRN